MVSVLGSASGVFAVSARQFQSKAQDVWQGLQKNAAAGGNPASKGLQDFIDPNTRARLEAQKNETDSLAKKLASGGEDAKEAAARKKQEAQQKLKMLKLQAQLAAASGDKKAAARIAKEAASVAKELGQAAKDHTGGGNGAVADSSNSTANAAQSASSGEAAAAGAEAQAVAQQASQTAQQPAAGQEAQVAVGTDASRTPPAAVAAGIPDPKAEAKAPLTDSRTDARTGAVADVREDIKARNDAILRDGAVRAGEAQFESEMRNMMDQLRAIHQQMKNLARKDGSAGTKSEMERAEQDMAEGDRAMAEAFGPPGGAVTAFAASPVRIDITA